MVREIKITQYRKLKNLELSFSPTVNAISGTNGTCKTSLLHLISNAFQAATKNCDWITDSKCLTAISAVNDSVNPKVESLTRGDRKYNDPAHGIQGILFTIDYFDRDPLGFRRHNSTLTTRYAVKPKYPPKAQEKLPYCPVIYLGLSRLVPFGEFRNDEAIVKIKKKLPLEYQNEISELYKKFTNYTITYGVAQQMGDIKTRTEFDCAEEGIDSNTISAGEDNLFIILTALVSLKYYYDSIQSRRTVESVLLIDEMDATLHPAYQIKLLNLLRDYAERYKIQVIFTTHSLSLLENMMEKKDRVLYLYDNETSVFLMPEPDIYKIKMHLQSLTAEDIYANRVIPIFSEDDEARFLIELLVSYFQETHTDEFCRVPRFFHYVLTNISAENLTGIFTDSKLLRMTMRSICILDGDHDTDVRNCIVALPSHDHESPEKLLIHYAKKLYDKDDGFWVDSTIIGRGYGKLYYREHVAEKVQEFERKLQAVQMSGGSTKGMPREFYKKLFNDNREFFGLLFKHWLHNDENKSIIEKFYADFRIVFKKVAVYNEINPNEWKETTEA